MAPSGGGQRASNNQTDVDDGPTALQWTVASVVAIGLIVGGLFLAKAVTEEPEDRVSSGGSRDTDTNSVSLGSICLSPTNSKCE